MITNCAKSVESYFRRLVEADACMLLTEDEDGVNSGVMFIRNCVKTKALIELIWLYDADVGNNTWEQFSLRFSIDNFPEVRRQILVEFNPKEFNSFPLEREIVFQRRRRSVGRGGRFICHFSGIREPHLSRYIERYARALKIDDAVATPPSRIRSSLFGRLRSSAFRLLHCLPV